MKHITFGQTNRDDFQIGIINSLKNYILNMDKRTDTKTIYYPNHIKQKISDFNNIAGLDFTFHINTDYNKKGTLNIVIRDRLNGNKPLPEVLYTKISDEN